MNLISYQDDCFYYFWKPYGIPSTPGKEFSFLDYFTQVLNGSLLTNDSSKEIILNLNQLFGASKEYGLLNRLDNDTSGLLYFAKSSNIFENYKLEQDLGHVEKTYLADVPGNFKYQYFLIAYPIMHHKHLQEKMVVIKSNEDLGKGRGQLHNQITFIEKLYYDEITNTSTLKVTINKGIRHQIRVHLASIGYPILGDILYNKRATSSEKLHLYSVGLRMIY